MTGSPAGTFWAYRQQQESLGKANGTQPFPTKAFNAGVSLVDFARLLWRGFGMYHCFVGIF
jgi:hypothetical protein